MNKEAVPKTKKKKKKMAAKFGVTAFKSMLFNLPNPIF